jgi:hypothetical protein
MTIHNNRLRYMVDAIDGHLDAAQGVLSEAVEMGELVGEEISTGVLVLETLERIRTARALLGLARS